jgi:hypothetical protein
MPRLNGNYDCFAIIDRFDIIGGYFETAFVEFGKRLELAAGDIYLRRFYTVGANKTGSQRLPDISSAEDSDPFSKIAVMGCGLFHIIDFQSYCTFIGYSRNNVNDVAEEPACVY